ncbi:uncharacterized protein LOC134442257 [Engraulis encrasicolus]|uniref:uncharacterized protein LOC134442257 n=1 Tax=Engraulis encrasicolus TaxID=184585 RepID=UPI002FD56C27
MECYVGLLVVLVNVKGFQLQGPSGPLVAQLGGSVLLPCAAESPLPLEELEVEWRRADSGALLHLFQEGEERPESQDQAYRGRAHFFPVDMAKGNFSILLKNVSEGDIGVYSCKVYIGHEAEEVRVDLVRVEYLVVTGSGVEVSVSLGEEVVLSCQFQYLVVTGLGVEVSVSLGEEAVLSCRVDSHLPPEELKEVTWRKTDEEITVLHYRHGEVLPDSPHHRYRGRAAFFTSEISKGNFSLRLKGVRTEDNGEYVCDVHTSSHTGKASVRILVLGLSVLHWLVLVCCVGSFVITSVALVHFISKGYRAMRSLARRNCKDVAVHFLLFLSPNALMFSGYLLWGLAEDVCSEAVACSVVNLTRILLLLLTCPYLSALHNSLQTWIKGVSVSLVYTVITVAVYTDAYFKRLHWISMGMFTTGNLHRMRLHGYFGATAFFSLCGIFPDIDAAYALPFLRQRSEPALHPQKEPSKQAFTFSFLEISSIFQMSFLAILGAAFKGMYVKCKDTLRLITKKTDLIHGSGLTEMYEMFSWNQKCNKSSCKHLFKT